MSSLTSPNAEPFLQAHYCHSGINLIASELEATQEGWYTSVQAIGSFAGSDDASKTETSNVQFLDTDIFPEQQRMKLVQSGLYSTTDARTREELANLDLGGVVTGVLGTITGGRVGLQTNVLNNYAVGVLHDEVREMYRGNVYMQGNAWIRPRHLIHFVDAIRQISGPVEVKEVTHSFSPQGGFRTTWVPDCIAFAHDTQKLGLITHALSATSRLYAAHIGLKALRNGRGRLQNGISKSLKFFGAVDGKVGRRVGALGNYPFYQVKRIGRNLFNSTPWGKTLANYSRGVKHAADGGKGIVKSDIELAFDNTLKFGAGSLRHGGRVKGLTGIGKKISITQEDREIFGKKFKFGPKNEMVLRASKEAGLQAGVLEKVQAQILTQQAKLLDRKLEENETDELKAFVTKIVDERAKGKEDADAIFGWLGHHIEPGADNFYRAVISGVRKNDVIRAAFSKVAKPKVSAATLKVLRDTLGKEDPLLSDVLEKSLGDDKEAEIADYIGRLTANLDKSRAELAKSEIKFKDAREGTEEYDRLHRARASVKNQETALRGLKKLANSGDHIAGAARTVLEFAESEKVVRGVTKVARGALKISELLVMAVVGPVITNLNLQRTFPSQSGSRIPRLQCTARARKSTGMGRIVQKLGFMTQFLAATCINKWVKNDFSRSEEERDHGKKATGQRVRKCALAGKECPLLNAECALLNTNCALNLSQRTAITKKRITRMIDDFINIDVDEIYKYGKMAAETHSAETHSAEDALEDGLLGCIPLVAGYFQMMMQLDFRSEASVQPPPRHFPPGPVGRAEGSLAARRLANPMARLYRAAVLAEVYLFPICVARTTEERDRYHREVGQILGLDRAVQAEMITGWVVCWPKGGFPKTPASVRLLTSGGRGARERCLGELAPKLRQFVHEYKAQYAEPGG